MKIFSIFLVFVCVCSTATAQWRAEEKDSRLMLVVKEYIHHWGATYDTEDATVRILHNKYNTSYVDFLMEIIKEIEKNEPQARKGKDFREDIK